MAFGALLLVAVSGLCTASDWRQLTETDLRMIEQQLAQVYPGAMITSTGPVTPCYCVEGPACIAMVEVIGQKDGEAVSIELAKSPEGWAPGAAWSHHQQYLDYYMNYVASTPQEAKVAASVFETRKQMAWQALQAARPSCKKPSLLVMQERPGEAEQ